MIFLFITGLLLLIILATGHRFFAKNPKTYDVLAIAASGLMLVGLGGLFFKRFLGNQVEFEHPYALLGLILPLLVWGAYGAFKDKFVRRINFPLTHLKTNAFSLRAALTRLAAPALYTLALCLLVIALARPMRVDRTTLPPTEGIDIILLMDVSGSMQNQDFYPTRFVAAQETAARFVDKRPTDRIGLVAFAKQAMLQAPLTLDHDALEEYIAGMYIGMLDPNYTAIGDALGVAANHLKDSKAKSKIIILLTDGDSNAGTIEPTLAAKAAQSYGIRVYTIGTASAPGQTLFSSAEDEINEDLLMEIANTTGGKFYRAKNENELKQIYETINQLETTAFTPSMTVHKKDVYHPLLLLALILVLGALVLEKLIFIKVP